MGSDPYNHERYKGEEYVELDELSGYLCTLCGRIFGSITAKREHKCDAPTFEPDEY